MQTMPAATVLILAARLVYGVGQTPLPQTDVTDKGRFPVRLVV